MFIDNKYIIINIDRIVYKVIVAASKNRLAWELVVRVRTQISHGAVTEPYMYSTSYLAILYIFSCIMVRIITRLLRTSESTILLWRRIHIRALEPIHGFLFVHALTILKQSVVFTPQLLIKDLWYNVPRKRWCTFFFYLSIFLNSLYICSQMFMIEP